MKHPKARRKASSRWLIKVIFTFMVTVSGLGCGTITHLFFSSMLPSVGMARADYVPVTATTTVLLVSSLEKNSKIETQVVIVPNGESFKLLGPAPTATPTLRPSATVAPLPSPTAKSMALAISVSSLPKASAILPPCGPGEEFFKTVDGRGFDATFSSGVRGPKFHAGIDGSCKVGGQAKWIAYAVADSRVIRYEFLEPGSSEAVELWSSGWTAVLAFTFEGFEYEAIYGHLEFPNKSENWPKVGDLVGPLSPLGRIGSTGASSGLHLHFGLRRKGSDGLWYFVNPEDHGILGIRAKK